MQASSTLQRNAGAKDATEEQKAKAKEAGSQGTEKADALFAEAAKLSEGTEHAARLGAPVFEKERLQIGKEVPDIVGEDVDGVAFKLSDYRGKVVMIDYWDSGEPLAGPCSRTSGRSWNV
jgi:hypothetical protein